MLTSVRPPSRHQPSSAPPARLSAPNFRELSRKSRPYARPASAPPPVSAPPARLSAARPPQRRCPPASAPQIFTNFRENRDLTLGSPQRRRPSQRRPPASAPPPARLSASSANLLISAEQIGVYTLMSARGTSCTRPLWGATAGSDPAPSCEFIEVEFRKRGFH